jgi:2'-5' RNA ligase
VPSPLILTLRLDDASQEMFNALRRAHFPPERNHIPAHLTLFHHLPGEEEAAIRATLAETCSEREPMTLRVSGLRSLGRGVAYRLESTSLHALRAELAREWEPWLTPQDRQKHAPHITVQNKVSPEVARATHERLQAEFVPFEARGKGLLLWRYLGGPWEPVGEYSFGGVRT